MINLFEPNEDSNGVTLQWKFETKLFESCSLVMKSVWMNTIRYGANFSRDTAILLLQTSSNK